MPKGLVWYKEGTWMKVIIWNHIGMPTRGNDLLDHDS